jgi:hypothetical protein
MHANIGNVADGTPEAKGCHLENQDQNQAQPTIPVHIGPNLYIVHGRDTTKEWQAEKGLCGKV